MLEKVEALLALVGLIGTACSVLAKLLPPGKGRDAARDLGFRITDALGVMRGVKK